jgi:serine/threonine protein kinase
MTILLKNGEYSYEKDRGLLGKGSFGSVYKGIIIKTNEVVAVKAMSLQLIKQYGSDIKEIISNIYCKGRKRSCRSQRVIE